MTTPQHPATPIAKRNIHDNLVYELITRGDGLAKDQRYGLTGWPDINDGGNLTYGITTWLVMKALDIHRLPWHPDERFTCLPPEADRERMRAILDDLKSNPALLQSACQELQQLHLHTVRYLSQQGHSTLRLSRSIGDESDAQHDGYATRLLMMQEAARTLGQPSFKYPSRVLSSWGSGGYGQYGVHMSMDVPIDNIAWGNDTVANRLGDEHCAIEGGEWVVLNRSLDGLVEIKVGDITTNRLYMKPEISFDETTARQFLEQNVQKNECKKNFLSDSALCSRTRLTAAGRIRHVAHVLLTGKRL